MADRYAPMVDGNAVNGNRVHPKDNCNWCNDPVGEEGAKTSVPGFPYCPPDQNKHTRKNLK